MWGSVVNHNLKLGSGFKDFIVFSKIGRKLITRCKFFKHTHWPFNAASFINFIAISF